MNLFDYCCLCFADIFDSSSSSSFLPFFLSCFLPFSFSCPGEVGQVTCKACSAGFYMFKFPVNIKCDACPAGRFSNESATILCSGCPYGYYQPATAQTKCLKCSQGRTFSSEKFKSSVRLAQQDRIDVDTECGVPCPVASYSLKKLPTWARTKPVHQCSVCAPGRAGLLCRQCPSGFTTENFTSSTLSVCSACYTGYYSEDPSMSCQSCPLGFYSDTMSATICTSCPSGYTLEDPPATSCVGCEPGQYGNFSIGQIERSCSVCEIGTFSGFGDSTCEGCPLGYVSQVGSTMCRQCVAGRISTKTKDRCQACGESECDNDGKSCENKAKWLPDWRTNPSTSNYEWPPIYFNISTTSGILRTCRRQICERDFVVLDLTNATAAAVYRSSEVTILPGNSTTASSAYALVQDGSAQVVEAALGDNNKYIVESVMQLGCFACPKGHCDHGFCISPHADRTSLCATCLPSFKEAPNCVPCPPMTLVVITDSGLLLSLFWAALGFCYLYFSNGDEEEEEEEQEEAAEEEADIASDVAKEKIQKTTAVLRQAVSDKIAKFTKQLWKLFYSRFHIFAVLALNIKFSIHSFIIQIIDFFARIATTVFGSLLSSPECAFGLGKRGQWYTVMLGFLVFWCFIIFISALPALCRQKHEKHWLQTASQLYVASAFKLFRDFFFSSAITDTLKVYDCKTKYDGTYVSNIDGDSCPYGGADPLFEFLAIGAVFMNLVVPILWAYLNHAPKKNPSRKGFDYFFCSNKYIHDEVTEGFNEKRVIVGSLTVSLKYWQDFADFYRIVIVGSTVLFSESQRENLFYFQIVAMSFFLVLSIIFQPFEGEKWNSINKLNIVVLCTELIAVLATYFDEPILQWILVVIFVVAFVFIQASSLELNMTQCCCGCNKSAIRSIEQHGTPFWEEDIDDAEAALFRTTRLHDCMCWKPIQEKKFCDNVFVVAEIDDAKREVRVTEEFMVPVKKNAIIDDDGLKWTVPTKLPSDTLVKGKDPTEFPLRLKMMNGKDKDLCPMKKNIPITKEQYEKEDFSKFSMKVKYSYVDKRTNWCLFFRNRTKRCCQQRSNGCRYLLNRCLLCPTQISMHPIKLGSQRNDRRWIILCCCCSVRGGWRSEKDSDRPHSDKFAKCMLIPAIIVVFALMLGLILTQFFSLCAAMICIGISQVLLMPFRFCLRQKFQLFTKKDKEEKEDLSHKVYFYNVKPWEELQEEERKKAKSERRQGRRRKISPDMLKKGQFIMTPNKKEITFTRATWLKWNEKKGHKKKIWYTYKKVTQGTSSGTKIVPMNASSTKTDEPTAPKKDAVIPAAKTSADGGNGMPTEEEKRNRAVAAMFHRLDLDHNGSLNKSELMTALMTEKDEELYSYVSSSRALSLQKQIFEPMTLEAFQNFCSPSGKRETEWTKHQSVEAEKTSTSFNSKKGPQSFYVMVQIKKNEIQIEDRTHHSNNRVYPKLARGSLQEAFVMHIPILFDLLQLPTMIACFGFFFVTTQLDMIRTQRIQTALQKRFQPFFVLHRLFERTQVLFLYLFLCHDREKVIIDDPDKIFDEKDSALNLWEDIKDEQITKKVQIVPKLPLEDLESSGESRMSPRSERRARQRSSVSKEQEEDNYKKLFNQFDLNKDEKVEYEELYMYMKQKYHDGNKEVLEADIKAMMLIADQDGNGHLDFKEFKSLIEHIEEKVDHSDEGHKKIEEEQGISKND